VVNEVGGLKAADILAKIYNLNHGSVKCMFYVPDKKVFLEWYLKHHMRDLKTLNLHLIFYLLELANLRLYKLTLNQIFAFLNGENCKVNSERTHYSASKLAHVVSYETDTDEIIKAIVP
jgi:hypothetical protein